MNAKTKVRFISQAPHTTQEIEIVSDSILEKKLEDSIRDMTAALCKNGWELKQKQGIGSLVFEKKGTGGKKGWTPAEKKIFLKEAKKILKDFGFKSVPYQKLTIGDL